MTGHCFAAVGRANARTVGPEGARVRALTERYQLSDSEGWIAGSQYSTQRSQATQRRRRRDRHNNNNLSSSPSVLRDHPTSSYNVHHAMCTYCSMVCMNVHIADRPPRSQRLARSADSDNSVSHARLRMHAGMVALDRSAFTCTGRMMRISH